MGSWKKKGTGSKFCSPHPKVSGKIPAFCLVWCMKPKPVKKKGGNSPHATLNYQTASPCPPGVFHYDLGRTWFHPTYSFTLGINGLVVKMIDLLRPTKVCDAPCWVGQEGLRRRSVFRVRRTVNSLQKLRLTLVGATVVAGSPYGPFLSS